MLVLLRTGYRIKPLEKFTFLVDEGWGHPLDCSVVALWAPATWGKWCQQETRACRQWEGGGELQRAIAAQEVSWLLVVYMVLLCELEKSIFPVGEYGSFQDP